MAGLRFLMNRPWDPGKGFRTLVRTQGTRVDL
jgi:hypothetical protein